MKQTIERLLQSIEAGATPKGIEPHTRKVRAALDAGVFDCLVRHPSNEPPDTTRRVLVSQYAAWHIGQYKNTSPPYKRRLWHVAGVCTVEMLEWRELPPALTAGLPARL